MDVKLLIIIRYYGCYYSGEATLENSLGAKKLPSDSTQIRQNVQLHVLPCLAIPTSISYIHYRSKVLEHLLIQGFFFV
jgi:hypothetical protein